jgi:hypothetical protein
MEKDLNLDNLLSEYRRAIIEYTDFCITGEIPAEKTSLEFKMSLLTKVNVAYSNIHEYVNSLSQR